MNTIAIFVDQYLYILVVLLGLLFFLRQSRATQKSMVICGAIIAVFSFIISRIAGHIYYDPRPFVVGHFTPLIPHAADNGFPSDHVLLTAAISAVIWFYSKKLSYWLWGLAVLIGAARVYSGVHHTIDIVGSIVIVLLVAGGYYLAVKYKFIKTAPPALGGR